MLPVMFQLRILPIIIAMLLTLLNFETIDQLTDNFKLMFDAFMSIFIRWVLILVSTSHLKISD